MQAIALANFSSGNFSADKKLVYFIISILNGKTSTVINVNSKVSVYPTACCYTGSK